MKRRGLTPDERALWRKAVRDVAPMRKDLPADTVKENPAGISKRTPLPLRGQPTVGAPQASTPASTKRQDLFQSGDPRQDRHVRRGRMAIDAVIDLHGHTQATARQTLLNFLIHAQAQNHRCVLVITGKGAPTRSAFHTAQAGRGILRARLGDWLKEDAFRALVTRAGPAHPKHGGGGAFYIFIKAKKRSPIR